MTVTTVELAAAISSAASAAAAASKGNTVWAPVVASAVTGVVTIMALAINHWLTRSRDRENQLEKQRQDEKNAADKHQIELRFISSGLIFLLEDFAIKCHDEIFRPTPGEDYPNIPELRLDNVPGDWKVLHPKLLYRIRALPVYYRMSAQYHAEDMQKKPNIFRTRAEWQEPHAIAGLQAIRLARLLRMICGFPKSRLSGHHFSVNRSLMMVIRTLREERHAARLTIRKFSGTVQPPPTMNM